MQEYADLVNNFKSEDTIGLLTIDKIKAIVKDEYERQCGDIVLTEYNNKVRQKEYVFYRAIVWEINRKYFNASLSTQGLVFKKDHATVLNGIRKIQNLRDTEPAAIELQILDNCLKYISEQIDLGTLKLTK